MAKKNSSLFFGGAVLFVYFAAIAILTLVLIPGRNYLFLLFLFATNIFVGFTASRYVEEKMALRLQEAEREAMIDPRTGLNSNRYITRRILEEMHHAERNSDHRFSLVTFELKGLKAYMETLGDEARKVDKMRHLTALFLRHLRTADVASCFDDERFVILTRQYGESRRIMAERLKPVFEKVEAEVEGQGPLKKIDLCIRTVEYPGEQAFIEKFLDENVEVA